MSYLVREP